MLFFKKDKNGLPLTKPIKAPTVKFPWYSVFCFSGVHLPAAWKGQVENVSFRERWGWKAGGGRRVKGLTRGREGSREVAKVPDANEVSRSRAGVKGEVGAEETQNTHGGLRMGEGPSAHLPHFPPGEGGQGMQHCFIGLVVKGLASQRLQPEC